MQLKEISGILSIDRGAPSPTIISNENKLYLIFYSNPSENNFEHLQQRNNVYDKEIFTIEFDLFLNYKFGMPSNELISGHPYYQLGLELYSFYRLENSNWIKELMKIGSIHPYFNREKWKKYNHYILTFHDSMFECVAETYKVKKKYTSIFTESLTIIDNMNIKMF